MTTSAPPLCSPRSGPQGSEDPAAADVLALAASWADLHPPESIHHAAAFTVRGCEHEEPIAGRAARWWRSSASPSSAPPSGSRPRLRRSSSVTPSSCATASPDCGRRSTPAGCRRGGPGWSRRPPSTLPPPSRWKPRGGWTPRSRPSPGRIGTAQLDRLVAEAIKRFDLAQPDPAADPDDGYLEVDPRHATLHDEDVHFAGTMSFEAELDIADALDLDRAITQGAATLKALGSEDSLNARRAAALGDLARTQTALDLSPGQRGPRRPTAARSHGRSSSTPTSTPSRRPTADDLRSHRAPRRRPTPAPARPGPRLVRRLPHQGHHQARHRPQADLTAAGYAIPDRIREQIVLRDRTCVFPWCTRPARGCDIDHIVELRPRRRSRRQAPTRSDNDVEPRVPVSVPPPTQDPHRLALHDGRARGLRVDQPPRPPLPTRHHGTTRSTPDPPDRP